MSANILNNSCVDNYIIPYVYNKNHKTCIETELFKDKNLNPQTRLIGLQIYHRINLSFAKAQKNYVDLSDEFLADFFDISVRTIQRSITELIKNNYIERIIVKSKKRYVIPDIEKRQNSPESATKLSKVNNDSKSIESKQINDSQPELQMVYKLTELSQKSGKNNLVNVKNSSDLQVLENESLNILNSKRIRLTNYNEPEIVVKESEKLVSFSSIDDLKKELSRRNIVIKSERLLEIEELLIIEKTTTVEFWSKIDRYVEKQNAKDKRRYTASLLAKYDLVDILKDGRNNEQEKQKIANENAKKEKAIIEKWYNDNPELFKEKAMAFCLKTNDKNYYFDGMDHTSGFYESLLIITGLRTSFIKFYKNEVSNCE